MEPDQIVALYWQRSESALTMTQQFYGRLMYRIARNLLPTPEDAKESVNDALLDLWNTIPPQRPKVLAAYLASLVRRRALDRYRSMTAEKRGGCGLQATLSELEECIDPDTPETHLDAMELSLAINRFVQALDPKDRTLFISRYYYGSSPRAIGEQLHWTENNVNVRLHRLRQQLRAQLIKEGNLTCS